LHAARFFIGLYGYDQINFFSPVKAADNLPVVIGPQVIHLRPMTDKPEDTPPDNETMREVKRAKARKEAADKNSGPGWKTAAGIGIGSAALAAALIYASKGRKKEQD
jgi:hypothetical protein